MASPNSFINKLFDKLLGRKRGRAITVYPDDRFIVSYPRSGNTWLRFLISNLVNPDGEIGFGNIDEYIPGIYKIHDRDLRRVHRPRILKSHEYYHPAYRKVIYLVRDPRDTAVSNYFYLQKIRKLSANLSIDEYIDFFIAGSGYSYGSWGEHAGGWLGAWQGTPDFLLLRYEDLHEKPLDELAKVAQFLGLRSDPAILEQAIQKSTLNRMRQSEMENRHDWKAMRASRQDLLFVRNGLMNHWKTVLSAESAAKIDSAWENQMILLGYENGSS